MSMLLRPRRARARSLAPRRVLALGATTTVAAAGLGALAVASSRRLTEPLDEAVREAAATPRRHPVRQAATAVGSLGKWWAYVPASAGIAAWLLTESMREAARRGPRRRPRVPDRDAAAGAGAIVLAGVLAAVAGPAFDRWLPQPPAPPGHASRRDPVFPSGHTFGPGTVALAAAYVLARQGRARGGVAYPLAAAVPLLFAGGRLMEERHWASDVAGGYLASLMLAGSALAAFEALRDD